ncbi:Protein FAM83F, partial [Frankliniella fusca]
MWGLQGELEVKPPLQLVHSAVQGGWRGIAIILSNYSKLHLIKGIACAAIERRDFYLLLDEADMRAFVLLRCKAFPVSRRHLIASTPLK